MLFLFRYFFHNFNTIVFLFFCFFFVFLLIHAETMNQKSHRWFILSKEFSIYEKMFFALKFYLLVEHALTSIDGAIKLQKVKTSL